MRLWRISTHASFDGEGAWRLGGRWSRPGTAVIYAAATFALATLELLVHLDRRRVNASVFAHYADIPDDVPVERVDDARLPPGWDRYPASEALQDIGTRWAAAATTLLLAVPSAVLRLAPALVPEERNYLLNAAHPAFSAVRVRSVRVALDPRRWTR